MKKCIERLRRYFHKKDIETSQEISQSKPSPIIHSEPQRFIPREWVVEALNITGSFEGKGYGQVTGDFDGQGLSCGILQWNYGQGSLQKEILLPAIKNLGRERVNEFFKGDDVASTAHMTASQAKIWLKTNGYYYKSRPNYKQAFWVEFMRAIKGIQIDAANNIAEKAYGYCDKYELVNLHAFCFFFDIVVQNGSLKGHGKPESTSDYFKYLDEDGGVNKTIWLDSNASELSKLLYIWACRRVVRNKWASDVISRKGTIAHKAGIVHGHNYNLKDKF